MTVAAPHIAMALDVIRPFAESSDARLRGNAVVALTALVNEQGTDLTDDATIELVRILCAEPGEIGLDWQRRFAGISINAIGDLDAKRSGLIGLRMLQQVRDSSEPVKQTAIARLILTACDHGRQLWPIGWRQFRRCANLAGRPGFWQCVWAALWRLSIAWVIIASGSEMIDENLIHAEFEELADTAAAAALLTAFGLAFVMRLSIPGNLRPPPHVYVRDIVFNAILFGLVAPLGALAVLPSNHIVWSDDPQLLLGMLGLFVLAGVVGAAVRCMRWMSAVTVLEPDGTSHFVRPAAALGISTLACVVAAHAGMAADIAAAAFLGIVPAVVVLSLLDLWLEEKGPRTLLPQPTRKERRWILPVAAGVSMICAFGFLGLNLQTAPVADMEPLPVMTVALSPEAQPVTIDVKLGDPFPVQVTKEGSYRIGIEGSGLVARSQVSIKDAAGTEVGGADAIRSLVAGDYTACARVGGSDVCAPPQPKTLSDHLIWAFGKFEPRPVATITFTPEPASATAN
jgi:hypothetical protein